MRSTEERTKERARDRRLAKGFGAFLKDTPISTKRSPEAKRSTAEAAFWALSREARDKVRAAGAYDTYEAWFDARVARRAGKANRQRDSQAAASKNRARSARTIVVKLGNAKMLEKHVRAAMKIPVPPKNPYAALMQPMVIAPANATEKPVIADAGTIIRLADQHALYRDWISPITHRADELLVQYGTAKTPKLGWISNKFGAAAMKPSKGPTYLVTTKDESAVNGWEQFRLHIARARLKNEFTWLVPWLATHGHKYPQQLREVTRFFGGKPIKNEPFDERCARVFTLILNTEIDMAVAKKNTKSSKTTKSAKTKKRERDNESPTKKSKKSATKKPRLDASSRVTKRQDDYVIRRLVKENPRRTGTKNAKIWDKLKKGMTVGEFVKKGGDRAAVGTYVRNGWVKLRKPANGDA